MGEAAQIASAMSRQTVTVVEGAAGGLPEVMDIFLILYRVYFGDRECGYLCFFISFHVAGISGSLKVSVCWARRVAGVARVAAMAVGGDNPFLMMTRT